MRPPSDNQRQDDPTPADRVVPFPAQAVTPSPYGRNDDASPRRHARNELAGVLPMAGTKHERRRLLVGIATHRAIARVASGTIPDALAARVRLCREAACVAVDEVEDISTRRPYAKAEAATAVGVYLAKFVPQQPWQFVASEVPLPGCRLDIVWEHADTGERLIDEIKMTAGRTLTEAYHPQVRAQLAAASAAWGDSLVGLRLLSLSSPRDSRFYVPGRRYMHALLDETPWWKPGVAQ